MLLQRRNEGSNGRTTDVYSIKGDHIEGINIKQIPSASKVAR